jgi:hypothetical protein
MSANRPLRILWPLLTVLAAACGSTDGLLKEPKPTDPNDGYEGILPKAGIDTTMDWGQKQTYLLADFEKLQNEHAKLQRSYEDLLIEKQNLLDQIAKGGSSFERERALRAQAEAETELLRGRRRELEARILSLSLEKAKLEQDTLLAKIEALQASLAANSGVGAMEAAAPAPERR